MVIQTIHFNCKWMDLCLSTFIGTLIHCIVECPVLLFAGGSVAGKGTGPNLQHLVASSPCLSIALARTSKHTTTCHIMSHVSESIRIYQNLSSTTTTPQTKMIQNGQRQQQLPNIKQLNHCLPCVSALPLHFHSISTPFPLRFHSKSTLHSSSYLLLALQKFITRSTNICNLDSGSSCLCVSSCKHCSQSAASAVSATAACTVSALTFSDRNDVDELNFQGRTVKISSTGKH